VMVMMVMRAARESASIAPVLCNCARGHSPMIMDLRKRILGHGPIYSPSSWLSLDRIAAMARLRDTAILDKEIHQATDSLHTRLDTAVFGLSQLLGPPDPLLNAQRLRFCSSSLLPTLQSRLVLVVGSCAAGILRSLDAPQFLGMPLS